MSEFKEAFEVLKTGATALGLIIFVSFVLACGIGKNSCKLTLNDKVIYSNYEPKEAGNE